MTFDLKRYLSEFVDHYVHFQNRLPSEHLTHQDKVHLFCAAITQLPPGTIAGQPLPAPAQEKTPPLLAELSRATSPRD